MRAIGIKSNTNFLTAIHRNMLRSFLMVVLLLSAGPQPVFSFVVDITSATRTMRVLAEECQETINYSENGPYSNLLWCLAYGEAIESEIAGSDIPDSGSYDTYTISADMMVKYDETAGPITWGIAEAETDILFSFDGPVDFSLTGSVEVNGSIAGGIFQFSGPDGELCYGGECFPTSGALPAGQYHLNAYVGAGVGMPNPENDVGSCRLIFNLEITPALSGVEDSGGVMPNRIQLFENFPNPFNPQTTIAFDLPKQEAVRLAVYDVSGRMVDVLIDNEIVSQGHNEFVWRGRSISGHQAPSGIYYYRLEAGSFSETKRMVLVK